MLNLKVQNLNKRGDSTDFAISPEYKWNGSDWIWTEDSKDDGGGGSVQDTRSDDEGDDDNNEDDVGSGIDVAVSRVSAKVE